MNNLKFCCRKTCKQNNPQLLFNFSKNKNKEDGLQDRCKFCDSESSKKYHINHYAKKKKRTDEWKAKNPNKVKGYLLSIYWPDLSSEEAVKKYNDLLEKQRGVCAICNKHETAIHRKGNPKVQSLAVDHCHKTGKIRGLLCFSCNRALGYLKDDKELLQKALDYLSE